MIKPLSYRRKVKEKKAASGVNEKSPIIERNWRRILTSQSIKNLLTLKGSWKKNSDRQIETFNINKNEGENLADRLMKNFLT